MIEANDGAIRPVDLKVPRSIRRTVSDLVPSIRADAILRFARSLHRRGDRAGLLACADLETALGAVLAGREVSLEAARQSERALDLLRFCLFFESPLWGARG
jgi:hypothetical protein